MNYIDRVIITALIWFAIMVINDRSDAIVFFIFWIFVISFVWNIGSFLEDREKKKHEGL